MHRISVFSLAALGSLVGGACAVANTPVFYRVVVKTGDVAPGTGGGAFGSLGYPRLNDRGEIAVSAAVDGGTHASGIWSEGVGGPGHLAPVVLEGQAIPVGGLFGSFAPDPSGLRSPEINNRGSVTFDFDDQDSGRGIALQVDGVLRIVARTGSVAPGIPGAQFSTLPRNNALSNLDRLAFYATVEGGGTTEDNDETVWLQDDDAMTLVAREGTPLDGAEGLLYGPFGKPTLTDAGRLSFTTLADDDGMTHWAMLSGGAGSMAVIAQEGEPAPILGGGTLGGRPIGSGRHSPNDAGDTLFTQDAEVGEFDLEGLWVVRSNQLSAVAVVLEPSPFGEYYISVGPFTGSIVSDGSVVFAARVAGGVSSSTDSAVFRRLPSGETLVVAREGDQAPGQPVGVVFGEMSTIPHDGTNQYGQVICRNSLRGSGVTEANDYFLWATTTDGEPVALMREGQLLELSPRDTRQVANAGYVVGYGAESGIRSALNAAGQVALRVQFTDATEAIVIASLAASCVGDVDGDLMIGFSDLNLLLGAFNDPVSNTDERDLDRDGVVDFADLNLLLSEFGQACPE